jgi:pantetheine-phosphate adenylyltransferase
MTTEQYGFISSTLIRQVASLGGDISNMVPANVNRRLAILKERKCNL